MAVYELEPAKFYYTFGPHEPALRVHSGDTVVVVTRDAFGYDSHRNPLPEAMKQRVPGTSLKESNPLVGPIYVEEAEEGDLLAVHIRRIRINRDFAISKQSKNFGSLTGEYEGHILLYNDPIPTMWYEWKLDLERNVGILELPGSRLGKVEVPLRPFIGSIGVAPAFGREETSLTPGEFGGNMDCIETREGTTLYLPVWARGAYLLLGDVHALQGDGEIDGNVLLDAEVGESVGGTDSVRPVAELGGGRGEVVLVIGVLDVSDEFASLTDEMESPSEEIASRPPLPGVDVGEREGSSFEEGGDLGRVDPVVLGLAAVDRLHVESVPQHEGDPGVSAEIGEPIPCEHALGADDQVVREGSDCSEEGVRFGT